MKDGAVIVEMYAGKRLLRPKRLSQDDLWSLVLKCLTHFPGQRPTAEEIAEALAGYCQSKNMDTRLPLIIIHGSYQRMVRDLSSYSERSCME